MALKYERLADDLRESIRSGELAAGEQLPTSTTLSEKYGVSLPTVRQALDVLRTEGLIDSRQGVGVYVRPPRRKVVRSNTNSHFDKARVHEPESARAATGSTERNTGLDVSELEFEAQYAVVNADEDLAGAFNVPVGTKLLRRDYRTRSTAETAPFNLARSYLIYDMVAANPRLLDEANEPWPGGTQHQLSTIGIELDRIIEAVTTRPPTPAEAEQLDIAPGVPVFLIRKTSVDTTGRVVDIADVTLPGDRTELVFETPLERWTK
ncbi:GntR family transcriptional regulator [Nocardia sp. NPDC006044]|uniref:GntR family transcriptional regulator n=1 Tax=Nocardia sp. NPDC006044 TaxID=3364306 RepID=UPI0036A36EE6